MREYDVRKMERFELNLPAQLSVNGSAKKTDPVKLHTVDISAGGAFFRTSHPMPIGTSVKVEVIVSLDELKRLKGKRACVIVSGAVVRTDVEGMAVCFNERYKILPMPMEVDESRAIAPV